MNEAADINEVSLEELKKCYIRILKQKEKQRDYTRKLRSQVLNMLGDKCVYCGCDIQEVLQINHKNGEGNKEFKSISDKQFYLNIIKGRRKTDDLEITCPICNSWHYLIKIRKIPDRWKIIFK